MHFELKALIDKANETCRSALEQAAGFCLGLSHYEVDIEHVLCKLLERQDADMTLILSYYDVDVDKVRADLEKSIEQFKRGNARTPSLSPNLSLWLQEAWLFSSLLFHEDRIRSAALLHALLENPRLRATLPQGPILNLSRDRLRLESASLIGESCEGRTGFASQNEAPKGSGSQNPANSKTPNLDLYTVDLTARARADEMDPIGGRDREIQSLIDILVRRRQNNPILLGEAGVGKTAIVEGLALRIAKGRVPPILTRVSLRVLDLGLLQAGAGVRGEFENRLKNLIKEIKHSDAPVILFVDEAHSLIGAGGAEGSGDAANLLKPALARGELRAIAATTRAEYKKYIEKDPALARRFQPISIEEPSVDKTLVMLRALVDRLEAHHGVLILEEALQQAASLSHRYITGRQLPDKAVGVLDTACARVALSQCAISGPVEAAHRLIETLDCELTRLMSEKSVGKDHEERIHLLESRKQDAQSHHQRLKSRHAEELELVKRILKLRAEDRSPKEKALLASLSQDLIHIQGQEPMVFPEVDAHVVASVVAEWTGVPLGKMLKDDVRRMLELPEALRKRVIGQDHALSEVPRRIRSSKADLTDPGKPVGVFMLVGPSGVGKTETALALADLLYGGEDKVITVNMSEFQEAHTVSSLKGAPPGYVGYGKGGVLTEAVRKSPYSVVLLDEIEKAHPDVLELFFQVFDKGYMEDGEGVHINFRNTLILLTSNVGGETLAMRSGPERAPVSDALAAIKKELYERFQAAFLGRLTVIPYFALDKKDMTRIVQLKLDRIVQRMRLAHKAALNFHPEVAAHIVSRCAQHESGARDADNLINKHVVPQISLAVLNRIAEERPFNRVSASIVNAEIAVEIDEAT